MLFEDKIGKIDAEYVKRIARQLGIEPDWLMALMWHESRLNPKAKNSLGCVGLIQFCPKTLDYLGYTTDQLLNMSFGRQLNVVKQYFNPFAGKMKSPLDLFLATFYPYALRKKQDLNYKFGSEKSDTYAKTVRNWNKAFDRDKDGYISMRDYICYHNDYFRKLGLPTEPVQCGGVHSVNKTTWLILGIIILIAIGLFLWLKR